MRLKSSVNYPMAEWPSTTALAQRATQRWQEHNTGCQEHSTLFRPPVCSWLYCPLITNCLLHYTHPSFAYKWYNFIFMLSFIQSHADLGLITDGSAFIHFYIFYVSLDAFSNSVIHSRLGPQPTLFQQLGPVPVSKDHNRPLHQAPPGFQSRADRHTTLTASSDQSNLLLSVPSTDQRDMRTSRLALIGKLFRIHRRRTLSVFFNLSLLEN